MLNMEIKEGHNNIISGHSNTLDKYYELILDREKLPPARDIMEISEGGLRSTLDKQEGKIYYKHKFKDFRNFVNI